MVLVEYFEAEKRLKKYGIRSVKSAYVESARDAIDFAAGDKIVLMLDGGVRRGNECGDHGR